MPRSATSPLRGGAGGRLSSSWHMCWFYRATSGRARRAAQLPAAASAGPGSPSKTRDATSRQDAGRPFGAGVGQPVVLLVGLGDQPVEQGGVQPTVDGGQLAQGLEAGALGQHRGGDELELDQVAER